MLLLLIIGALTLYFFFSFYSKVRQLPPGPTPLPIIGNFHQIAWGMYKYGNIIKTMKEWQKEYGDVFTSWIGPMPSVNIADHNLSVDAMIKNGANFADRTVFFLLNIIREGRGLIVSNGQHWLEQRRFSLHTLRNFGLGKNIMQDRVMLEFDSRRVILDKEIEKAGGEKSIDMAHFLDRAVGNIINRIIFSEPFGEDKEDRFFKIKQMTDELMEKASIFDMLMAEWNIDKWPFKPRYDRICELLNAFLDFIREQIEKRKAAIASGEHVLREDGEDFVDAYLMEMQKEDRGDSFNMDSLAVTALDLWAAGQETTATSLYWAFSYLAQDPQVIEKLHKEVDEVTRRNRPLELADKPNTPYLNATILEVLRASTIAPLNFWRTTADDTVIGSYRIPKGTAVTAQLSLMLYDEKKFPEPEKFLPDRFIENPSLEQFVTAFGLGKRACLGESLARAEMYLILGNFVLSYNFSADPSQPPSMVAQKESGTMRRANHYRIIVSKRD